jgi:hypothetical protein
MEQIKIESGRKIPTDEEFIRWSDEAAALVHKYDWENRSVWPWNYPIPVTKIINDIHGAAQYSFGSKWELYLLAKGLTDIFNAWEKKEIEGVTLKNLKTGKIFKIDKEFAEEMMKDMPGKYEVVE